MRMSRQIGLIKETSRNLRKNQTPSEKQLWSAVRDRKLGGRKFYRQHPLKVNLQGQERFFVADFYCYECGIVVEMDGKIHEHQQERDELRTYLINQLGLKVLRVKNEELEDLPKALERILRELARTPPAPLSSQERGDQP